MQYPHDKPPVASTSVKFSSTRGSPGRAKSVAARRFTTSRWHTPSNDVLSMDFKGWFRTADGERIDPLTVVDNYSRYALCCQALDKCDGDQYGLPRAMRSDNGASHAIASRLSVWLIKLGITVERIPPATPSANNVAATHG